MPLQHDKLYTFEDPKSSPKNPESASIAAQGWIDILDRAKEMALSCGLTGSYSSDNKMRSSPIFSSSNRQSALDMGSSVDDLGGLPSSSSAPEPDVPKSRKRFSKRQSKSGLTAVF